MTDHGARLTALIDQAIASATTTFGPPSTITMSLDAWAKIVYAIKDLVNEERAVLDTTND